MFNPENTLEDFSTYFMKFMKLQKLVVAREFDLGNFLSVIKSLWKFDNVSET